MSTSGYKLRKRVSEESETQQEGPKKKIRKTGKRKYVEPLLIDSTSKFPLHIKYSYMTLF